MIEQILQSISHFYPELTLVVALCAIVTADFFLNEKDHTAGWILFGGLVLSGIFVLRQLGWEQSIFSDMIAVDPFAIFFKVVLIIVSLFIVLFSMRSGELEAYRSRVGEYYMLLAGMILGMFLMVSSTNLLLMYLAFEMTSISSYVLSGFTKESSRSAEASMKFIIFGGVSSGVLLYGISLLCGITGAVDIYGVNEALATGIGQPLVLTVSILMIIAGLGFKIAVVPFHFWAPDVYEGAPYTISAFLAIASKIAAFAMLIRFFTVSFIDIGSIQATGAWSALEGVNWNLILAVTAALAMIVGNLTALRQDNIKRMLAYSSIAHAGYILMGLVVLSEEGLTAIMIYVIIYLFMNLGAFYVAMLFSDKLGSESIEDFKGLGYRAPLESVSMTVFLVALTGLPPTGGFIAKLYIFGTAVSAGWIWLVVIAGVTTVISLFYYIRVVRNLFLVQPAGTAEPLVYTMGSKVILIMLLIPVLVLGIYFTPVLEFARYSIHIFGM